MKKFKRLSRDRPVNLHQLLMQQLALGMVRNIVAKKLVEEGIKASDDLSAAIARHILDGNNAEFEWDIGNTKINFTFTEEDAAKLRGALANLLDKLPDLINELGTEIAKVLLRTLKKNWPHQSLYETAQTEVFASALSIIGEKPSSVCG